MSEIMYVKTYFFLHRKEVDITWLPKASYSLMFPSYEKNTLDLNKEISFLIRRSIIYDDRRSILLQLIRHINPTCFYPLSEVHLPLTCSIGFLQSIQRNGMYVQP